MHAYTPCIRIHAYIHTYINLHIHVYIHHDQHYLSLAINVLLDHADHSSTCDEHADPFQVSSGEPYMH